MFACPILESELLGRIEALAARPLAELLLQQGILRTMAQEILLRDLREAVTFTANEEPVILSRLWEGVEGPPPTSLAGDWIANLPEPLRLGMGQRWDQVRLQKLIETRYSDRLEPYFLERRKDLEQVVYGLIRLRNQGAAEELYLRLLDDGADFTELARIHSVGEERFTHGLVGPMLITQPHPTIRAVLESLKVGDVHAPFRVEQWVLLVRMEHRQPASLNDATRIQLMQELLQQELDETLDAMLAAFYPTLVPMEGANTRAALPAAVEVAGQEEEPLEVEEPVNEEEHAGVESIAVVEREMALAGAPFDEACAEANGHEMVKTASDTAVTPVAASDPQEESQLEAEAASVVASLAGLAEASSSTEQENAPTEPAVVSTVEADLALSQADKYTQEVDTQTNAEILAIAEAPPIETDPWDNKLPIEVIELNQTQGSAETAVMSDSAATAQDPLTGNVQAADNALTEGEVMVTSEVTANAVDPRQTQIVLTTEPMRDLDRPSLSYEDPVTGELAAEVESLVIKDDCSAIIHPLSIEVQNDSESHSGEFDYQEIEASLSAELPLDTEDLSVPEAPAMVESLAAEGSEPLKIGEMSAEPNPPQATVSEDPWATESRSIISAPQSAG